MFDKNSKPDILSLKKIFTKRILFVGMPDMAEVCLDGLVEKGFNIVGIIGPKKTHPTYLKFKNLVIFHKLNFIEYDKLNEENLINTVKSLNPDIAVVCSFNYKIPKVLLDLVPDGFINVHPSLLPNYRGPNPYSAVILNGEEETGVTLHFMDENFDTGDIIFQKSFPLLKNETMGTLFNRLNMLAVNMLTEILEQYEKNTLKGIKQPQGEFKISKALSNEEIQLNFSNPAIELERLIRSLNPFILARSSFRKVETKILSAEVVDEVFPKSFSNGEIVKVENNKIFIATGKGLLVITALTFGSFFAGSAKLFINIVSPKIGEKFV